MMAKTSSIFEEDQFLNLHQPQLSILPLKVKHREGGKRILSVKKNEYLALNERNERTLPSKCFSFAGVLY